MATRAPPPDGTGAPTALIRRLRAQVRRAIERFVQGLLDHPPIHAHLTATIDPDRLPRVLWREGLVIVYRLLFILRRDPATGEALAPRVRAVLDRDAAPDLALGAVVRNCCQRFATLGGLFFGTAGAPTLAPLPWPERAVAELLDALLWLPDRAVIRHEDLAVEDLGRIYEALLALEPGLAREPMVRLRRAKLELVVPVARTDLAQLPNTGRTRVAALEKIPAGRFFLRAGLGRKETGTYYTPQPFVRFLVEQTLAPLIEARSPADDPRPLALLELRVLDPAMGSGHFLVEACRFLGDALLDACRRCRARADAGGPEADAWRARITALPAARDEITACLLEHAPNAIDHTARDLCRRLVAERCLYGVDRDPLAVALARASLWLAASADVHALDFLDDHLVCGDALTGPSREQLLTCPRSGDRLDALTGPLTHFLEHHPAALRLLARAWTGGVMLGDACDDDAYRELARAVAHARPIADLCATPAIAAMLAAGEGALAFDLQFPAVLRPRGQPRGFDVVLGNPPWDTVLRVDDEFFAAFDLRALTGAGRPDKLSLRTALLARPEVAARYAAYLDDLARHDRVYARLFTVHRAEVAGNLAGRGTYDAAMLFAERGLDLLAPDGRFGMVLPSGFHANEGAVGLRRLLLDRARLQSCYSFENRRRLFEIDSRFKFALVTAAATGPTDEFACAFYLHDPAWLRRPEPLRYTRAFLAAFAGPSLAFPELRSQADVVLADTCHRDTVRFADFTARHQLRLSQQLNLTYEAHRFTPADPSRDARDPAVAAALHTADYFVLHEGRTFHQFDDRWADPPRHLVARTAVADRPTWLAAARHYRLAFRDIARSTDERTGIFCLLPPGVLAGNTAPIERDPGTRATADALILLALANSFAFDWQLRHRAAAHVNLFILNDCPLPRLDPSLRRFLAHAALRLSCNHAGYAPLWREQLDARWREPSAPHSWPALRDMPRKTLRAAVDAAVADAFGLDRPQFAHLLAAFSHRSDRDAPARCLDALDRLRAGGRDVFLRDHDPYHDVPLVTSTAAPVLP